MKVRFGPGRIYEQGGIQPGVGLIIEAENADEDRIVREVATLPTPLAISTIFAGKIDPKGGRVQQIYHEKISRENVERISRAKPKTREAVQLLFRVAEKPDVIPGEIARGAAEAIREGIDGIANCVSSARTKKSVKVLKRIFDVVEGFARDIGRNSNIRALQEKERIGKDDSAF